MANEKFTQLPTVTNSTLADIIAAVQAGTSVQQTLAQILTLMQSNIIQHFAGDPNGNVAGTVYGLCWDTSNNILYICTTSGNTSTAVWESAGSVSFPVPVTQGGTGLSSTVINQILYSSANDVIAGLPTANNGVLITSAGGVPSIASTLPTAVQANITQLGAQSQALNMNSHLINNVTDPVSAQDAATKNYVDQTALTGTSVYAASAASLGTVTQAGSGVGATLTNAGAQATFALDGVNPPLGSSVLIKNTATGMTAANEGIYTVTSVGSGSTNWVLTRDVDYDTPDQINETGLIVVRNGSTLAGTAWYNTATIVTVDTTNFNYAQFGASITFFKQVALRVITSTSTYTPTANSLYYVVEGVGGGAGGGGAAGTAGQSGQGGGGGGGGYFRKVFNSTEMGANASVTIGAGGAGGTAGNNNGTGGGNTTFDPAGTGVTLTGNGGSAGAGSASSATVATANGGAGGSASNGDINIPGGTGAAGIVVNGSGGYVTGGNSGNSILSPCMANNSVVNTVDGLGYGSGGCGAAAGGGANRAGGAGTNGVIIVTEYIGG